MPLSDFIGRWRIAIFWISLSAWCQFSLPFIFYYLLVALVDLFFNIFPLSALFHERQCQYWKFARVDIATATGFFLRGHINANCRLPGIRGNVDYVAAKKKHRALVENCVTFVAKFFLRTAWTLFVTLWWRVVRQPSLSLWR